MEMRYCEFACCKRIQAMASDSLCYTGPLLTVAGKRHSQHQVRSQGFVPLRQTHLPLSVAGIEPGCPRWLLAT